MPGHRFLLGLLATLLIALAAAPARAQGFIAMAANEDPVLTPTEAAAFNRIFSTTLDQQHALQSLLGAAMTQIRDAQAKSAELFQAYNALPEDRRTPQARKDLRAKLDALNPDPDALRKTLLADLRALLTQDQESRWKKFEYFLRREQVLAVEHGWGHDCTNLLALVDTAAPATEPSPDLAALLDRYERDLDAILAELASAEAELNQRLARAQADRDDLDAVRKAAIKPYTRAAERLAQFNFQSVRRAAALLPPDQAARLSRLYDMISLSEAFGPNGPDLGIRSAPALPGLTDDTREKLHRIVAEYASQHGTLTERIADMERGLRQRDPSEKVLDLSDWDPVRMERGRLMSETQRKVQTLLTPEEFHAMLEEGARQERQWHVTMSR